MTERPTEAGADAAALLEPLAALDRRFASVQAVDLLRRDAGVTLYRVSAADASCLAAMAPAMASSPLSGTQRLRQEYALRAVIDPQWGAVPLALMEHRGQQLLMLADPGGTLLSERLAQPAALDAALAIGVAVARALDGLHGAALVHCDLKPENVLIDDAGESPAARLTGFGLAAEVREGRAVPQDGQAIEGTFAYMAPERTGRINRAVDGRADLYSFGVLLYRLLTGMLPFHATEPAEWVHCHLAQRPLPPHERTPAVPRQVSRIVMKLLEKAPEDRYQSAIGVAQDLDRCLSRLRQGLPLEAFVLFDDDVRARIRRSDTLYGREQEASAVAGMIERVRRDGTSAFVLVSGRSGVGKSALVDAVRRSFDADTVRFAAGKFDQYVRDIPYATLSQCFDALVRQVLSSAPDERETWRLAIEEALGANARLLVGLVPVLETLIGAPPALPVLTPAQRQARFQSAIQRFLRVFASAQRPLVLFLDDLQWLDDATLCLLEDFARGADVPHLVWICAYRDAEADMTPSLVRTLDAIRSGAAVVQRLELEPLAAAPLTALVAEALACDEARAAPLAEVLGERTGGNPYFAIQLLMSLVDRGLLRFEPARQAWHWDLPALQALSSCEDAIDVTAGRLRQLPAATREALATLACLGNAASLEALRMAMAVSTEKAGRRLQPAALASLIRVDASVVAFVHDRVQEAAYALLPEQERTGMHLLIGRRLLAGNGADLPADAVFDIASHFLQAASMIESRAERRQVAALFGLAGDKARAASAHASALAYFMAGDDLLAGMPDDGIDAIDGIEGSAGNGEPLARQRFQLAWKRAECEFLTGQLQVADDRLAAIANTTEALPERAAIAGLRVTLYTAWDRSDRAIETGLAFLRQAGISWNERPSRADVRQEYDALLAAIGPREIGELIALPALLESRETATLDVLAAMLPPAFFSDEDLVCLILCRMARISVQHGNTDASSLAYAYLGMVVGPCFGDYGKAYRFGKLGYDLVQTRGLVRYKPRVYMTFAYHVLPWTRPFAAGDALLRRAFDEAVEAGDLTYAGYSSSTLISSRLAAGAPLAQLEREADEKLAHVRATRFGLIVDIVTAQRQMIRALRGATRELSSFDDGVFAEAEFEAHLDANRSLAIASCWYWIRRTQCHIYAGRFPEALAAAGRAQPLLWSTAGHLEYAEYHFFAGLAHAGCHAAADTAADTDLQRMHREAALGHLDKMRGWAQHAPANFSSRASLLAGEVARMEGRIDEAMQQLESAIASAASCGLIHDEALANEYAARLWHGQGLHSMATALLAEAARCYRQWGAHGKVAAIGRAYPAVAQRLAAAQTEAASMVATSPQALDLQAIIRSLQAVSDQGTLAQVIQSVMTIALEQAGAERAVLVLPAEKGLRSRAQARVGAGGVAVSSEDIDIAAADVPLSIVQAVIRSHAHVLIDDARERHAFAADPYFDREAHRSVLCLPLRRQSEMLGLLYLENSLISHAFTPQRLAVLQLLASTAAISIENAGLDEKTVLLKEVHHRVKNNLQLISSLLSLQASAIDDPDIVRLFAESRDRVRSMALAHENLYRAGNFARVAMADHLRNLCAQLARAYRPPRQDVTVRVDADEVELEIGRAISCGLIVNELVSNALKHGFVDGRDGTVTVRLHVAQPQQCVLQVADDGIGMGPSRRSHAAAGLGLELVDDLVAQLGGTCSVAHEHGLAVTIAFATPGQET